MIAPHHEDDDSAVDLPLLIQAVAGNTPVKIDESDEMENTTSTSTISLANVTTTTVSTSTTVETSTTSTSTSTKGSFLVPISG